MDTLCVIAMRIEIRRGNGKAVIVSFDTRSERFESATERNRFFRGLYGWEQVVPSERKNYRYRRPGLLDDVPHMKISDSVFMVAADHIKRVLQYFEQWHEKVEFDMFEVMLARQRMREFMRKAQERRNVEIDGD
jgi:hypothetical protein